MPERTVGHNARGAAAGRQGTASWLTTVGGDLARRHDAVAWRTEVGGRLSATGGERGGSRPTGHDGGWRLSSAGGRRLSVAGGERDSSRPAGRDGGWWLKAAAGERGGGAIGVSSWRSCMSLS